MKYDPATHTANKIRTPQMPPGNDWVIRNMVHLSFFFYGRNPRSPL
jgi:hypothetical protein